MAHPGSIAGQSLPLDSLEPSNLKALIIIRSGLSGQQLAVSY
jgi:hypothetical protein